jgi:hypothetical protein
LVMFFAWEEWLNVALGLWAIAAPWLLGFAHDSTAVRAHIAVGIAVVIIAGIELRLGRRSAQGVPYRRARAR